MLVVPLDVLLCPWSRQDNLSALDMDKKYDAPGSLQILKADVSRTETQFTFHAELRRGLLSSLQSHLCATTFNPQDLCATCGPSFYLTVGALTLCLSFLR